MIDLKYDKTHIWHPYTSMQEPLPVYPVTKADGVYIQLEDGRRLIDGMASWWCMIHGYNQPELNKAVCRQLENMSHVMFGGLTHEPAIELARLLVEITPPSLEKVFISDSGSVAVEVAIKMAKQFWINQGNQSKNKVLSLRGAYHGDTFSAMSVCDPETGMHHLFKDSMPLNYFAERPACRYREPCSEENISSINFILQSHHEEISAVILEPIVQGAGGMWFYSADYLAKIRVLCDEFNVLLIADEIATGFGRTGKLFACEHANISPDILCLGKALTGGYLSLAATLSNQKVSDGISKNGGVFMHGPTFMGNPLACATAIASINLLLDSPWQERVNNIERQLSADLENCLKQTAVQEIRTIGAIGVVEMKEAIDLKVAQEFFVSQGVWIRPFGRLLYIMPPYIIGKKELEKLTNAMLDFTRTV
ncbi:MAG: adenosylmethionine--8-amino-7-oxononanoate transaminase [Gammaproteobacteria bacterium]|jgi:adenosylmethionine---8-amino-7-oxononanoate aminotransferase|nr:adenosylmethionine--8-amino-7-oxononanoate transaminase [Gammaproteobacteria bacterium]